MAVKFTRHAAQRIGEATIFVERMVRNGQRRSRRQALYGDLGFWARITGQSTSDKQRYSWEALEPKDDDTLEANADWGEGKYDEDNYAIEATGSKWVLKNSVVWLMPSKTHDKYIFLYAPGVVTAKLISGGTISKRSGSTPGSGEVVVEDFDGSSFTVRQPITVYNPFRTDIEADDGDLIVQCSYGDGWWWVTGVECSTDGGP